MVYRIESRWYGIAGLGRNVFREAGCPVWQCEVFDYFYNSTKNNGIPLEEYDAVVFSDPNWDRFLPPVRSPHQRYIFWNCESPTRDSNWDDLGGVFNLTMTYRLDSDIVMPYGWFYPKTANINKRKVKPINYAQGKTKLVAWFVSNCHRLNGRLEYAKRLQDFITVDIYGKCGTLNCSADKTWQDDGCRDMVQTLLLFHFVPTSFNNAAIY